MASKISGGSVHNVGIRGGTARLWQGQNSDDNQSPPLGLIITLWPPEMN
jgi:hypothetical protein